MGFLGKPAKFGDAAGNMNHGFNGLNIVLA